MIASKDRDDKSKAKRPSGTDFELFSPTDFRYSIPELVGYLSEEAYVRYKCKVEAALARQLARSGLCSPKVAAEIQQACLGVTAGEVYEEESRIRHDIRALANVIRNRVSDESKPFVHLTATSYDIVDTANALRFKDVLAAVLIPDLMKLEGSLILLARAHTSTVQIGRTHGQHAEPITFGYYLSYYVSRLGERIMTIERARKKLVGKFSGAVGVYGPLSLAVDDPEKFETELLQDLGLTASEVTTQIVQPEPMADLVHSIVSTFGVLANFSRDMRNLQRSEVAEISEEFGSGQVGSSTMPQKRNPISFENVESLWKRFMPQMITVYLDQVSEHQRDLTNSSSQRYLPELLVIFDYVVRQLYRTIWNDKLDKPRLQIDEEKMKANLVSSADQTAAEPLYVLLSLSGHPDAHEYVRRLVQSSISTGNSFRKLARADKTISEFATSAGQKWGVVEHPEKYVGVATTKAASVLLNWERKMSELRDRLRSEQESRGS